MGWDTTSYGNNNIPVRGTNTCYGMYNNAWVSNTGWPGGTSNHSMCEWLNTYNCSNTVFKAVPYIYCSNKKSLWNPKRNKKSLVNCLSIRLKRKFQKL